MEIKENKKITTIKLEQETKSRLDKLKEHEKESYNQVLKKILYILNTFRKNPETGKRMIDDIDKVIKRRQVYQSILKAEKPKNSI